MADSNLYIGLMSGTSADAVDAVIVDFSADQPRLVASHSQPFDRSTRASIHNLALPGTNEIDRMGGLDRELGETFARVVIELLEKGGCEASQIAAIGSHGQTVRHRPPGLNDNPFSLQIGDPNIIAQRTGITTIADFRRRDMAAGGHGAPLVPAFHSAFFHSAEQSRAIVNVGGIANLTWLPTQGQPLGFDTGPGNVLLDAWIMKTRGAPYDQQGEWAASGRVDNTLLEQLLAHPYFTQRPPKSTGPEAFNLDWLSSELARVEGELAPEDVQATLLVLTAQTIAASVSALQNGEFTTTYLCGGGAYNLQLRRALETLLPKQRVTDTTELGIAPEWVEATAFAWLARQTNERKAGNLPEVTGAREALVLGGIYPA
ncbi:anhydro-N-acetylmuramic acid kinase [Marinimicrobium sp. ABcell2]|uniref:anhydro-N-acetylmuramic acid kinase n=1 Tax=Marinimicrobium sp. ABcell2 TaxID=3069751 RepID=UPI0027AFA3AD|nr:anhydro-N-acetylmuramic acid kinase [Marinimicrobium sp. ABcell2]MDQ2075717.1 anhydro-N-acetylmuramic acid kinase [Marinimicrobium sp. ABcell2]